MNIELLKKELQKYTKTGFNSKGDLVYYFPETETIFETVWSFMKSAIHEAEREGRKAECENWIKVFDSFAGIHEADPLLNEIISVENYRTFQKMFESRIAELKSVVKESLTTKGE